jgi:hypothetical protein
LVAAQEVSTNMTVAIIAKQSKIFFILLKSWVNKLIKEVPEDCWSSIRPSLPENESNTGILLFIISLRVFSGIIGKTILPV